MNGNGDEGQIGGLAESGNPVCQPRKAWATPHVILPASVSSDTLAKGVGIEGSYATAHTS